MPLTGFPSRSTTVHHGPSRSITVHMAVVFYSLDRQGSLGRPLVPTSVHPVSTPLALATSAESSGLAGSPATKPAKARNFRLK